MSSAVAEVRSSVARRAVRVVFRGLQQLRDLMVDAVLYSRERVRGRSFADFYAEKMDRLAVATPTRATGTPEAKRFQFEYLRMHGLEPRTMFLDYGCGTAAAGIHILEFLDAGHYTGADISSKVLDVARRRVVDAELGARQPRFIHIPSGNIGALAQAQFDIIWAQSVLTHMPPADIRSLLRNMRQHVRPGGVFYATFAYIPEGVQQRRIKDWYYGPEEFAELAAAGGYECRLMPDWRHPDGDVDRLAALSPISDTNRNRL